MEDGENWDQSTMGCMGVISSKYPLHYAMGRNHDEIIVDELSPPRVENFINEHMQFWHYRAWAEMMTAETGPSCAPTTRSRTRGGFSGQRRAVSSELPAISSQLSA